MGLEGQSMAPKLQLKDLKQETKKNLEALGRSQLKTFLEKVRLDDAVKDNWEAYRTLELGKPEASVSVPTVVSIPPPPILFPHGKAYAPQPKAHPKELSIILFVVYNDVGDRFVFDTKADLDTWLQSDADRRGRSMTYEREFAIYTLSIVKCFKRKVVTTEEDV